MTSLSEKREVLLKKHSWENKSNENIFFYLEEEVKKKVKELKEGISSGSFSHGKEDLVYLDIMKKIDKIFGDKLTNEQKDK